MTGRPPKLFATAHEAPDRASKGRPASEQDEEEAGSQPRGDATFRRRLFVRHQQQLAQQALLLDLPGGARAALRVLSGIDFVSAAEAVVHLRTLRDPRASRDEVIAAIGCILRMAPAGEIEARPAEESAAPTPPAHDRSEEERSDSE